MQNGRWTDYVRKSLSKLNSFQMTRNKFNSILLMMDDAVRPGAADTQDQRVPGRHETGSS